MEAATAPRPTRAARAVLVTGAASGIGRATASLLAARGDRVLLWDADADGLEATARELGVSHAVVDITNVEQVPAHMFEAVRELGGALDAVVHSAGILRADSFEQLPLTEQRAVIDVNFWGTVLVAHTALPHLRATRGSLLLMGSASSFQGTPEFATYGATKAAVLSLAQALRVELRGTGVHVGVCNPLFVAGPMAENDASGSSMLQLHGIAHTADDVARALVRALERRRFMIWPGGPPRWLWLASRHLHGIAHLWMAWDARRGARRGARGPSH